MQSTLSLIDYMLIKLTEELNEMDVENQKFWSESGYFLQQGESAAELGAEMNDVVGVWHVLKSISPLFTDTIGDTPDEMISESIIATDLSTRLKDLQKICHKALVFGLNDINPHTQLSNLYMLNLSMSVLLYRFTQLGNIVGNDCHIQPQRINTKIQKITKFAELSVNNHRLSATDREALINIQAF